MPQRVVALLQRLERKSIGSLQVPSSFCRHEQNVKLPLCTTFNEGEGSSQTKGKKSSVMTERWRYPAKSHHGEMSC